MGWGSFCEALTRAVCGSSAGGENGVPTRKAHLTELFAERFGGVHC